jgi:uncharacterized protein involved in exopolysaccharide biosynthesis
MAQGSENETRSADAERHEEVEEISLLELANVLLKRWKLVVGLPLLAAVLTAIISLLIPPKYTATATFVPEEESQSLILRGRSRESDAERRRVAGGLCRSPKRGPA